MLVMLKLPLALVLTERMSAPVSTLWTTTVAPATTAPLESVTVPVSVAASSCPRVAAERARMTKQTARNKKWLRTVPGAPSVEPLDLPHFNLIIATSPTPARLLDRKGSSNSNALYYIARDGS